MSVFDLSGEVALVTGGATGIGRAIAKCLAEAGAVVVIAGRRQEILAETAAQIGGRCIPMRFDVTSAAQAPEFVGQVAGQVGFPSILVNNAGIHIKKPALETDEAELLSVLNTHLIGSMALTRAVAHTMLARKRGSILFVSSMAAIFGIPNVAAYTAAKSAIAGVVRALAVEWSPSGVRVNAIAPGWIDSEMSRRAMENDPKRRERVIGRTPMGRFGNADEVGWTAVYLCSPAASFITGQQLAVDGGVSIGF